MHHLTGGLEGVPLEHPLLRSVLPNVMAKDGWVQHLMGAPEEVPLEQLLLWSILCNVMV